MMDFHGWPVISLTNNRLQLDALTAGGLRILRLCPAGNAGNLLVEAPDNHWTTPHGEYYLIGGHRLWVAPEIPGRTYAPEPDKVQVEELGDGLRLTAPVEAPTGLQKSILIRLDPVRPVVRLEHAITNQGSATVELAVWAITALPLGGTVILPQIMGPADSFQPNRHLVIWPYAGWGDRRLHLADQFISLDADSALPPCKIGYFNMHGWIGYLRSGILFAKHFEVLENHTHTDRGCNAEAYCNDRLVELETLSPLKTLAPGDSISHAETWELITGLSLNPDPEEIGEFIQKIGIQNDKRIIP